MTHLLPLIGWATLTAVALGAALHAVARTRQHWMVACLLAGGLYVGISVKLDQMAPQDLLEGVRWGVLGVVVFCFGRYRLAN